MHLGGLGLVLFLSYWALYQKKKNQFFCQCTSPTIKMDRIYRKHELETQLKDDHQLISKGVLRNEHPLDTSQEFRDFIYACRLGDLKRCQEMISAGVSINAKDEFDYTPLVIVSFFLFFYFLFFYFLFIYLYMFQFFLF